MSCHSNNKKIILEKLINLFKDVIKHNENRLIFSVLPDHLYTINEILNAVPLTIRPQMLYLGTNLADVAQLDRAFGYEPKGSRFESWHPQKKSRWKHRDFFRLPSPIKQSTSPRQRSLSQSKTDMRKLSIFRRFVKKSFVFLQIIINNKNERKWLTKSLKTALLAVLASANAL